MSAAGRADVALVADRVQTGEGWLTALARAAYSDDIHAGSGPVGAGPDGSLIARGDRLDPECCYIRRAALDLVGGFADRPTPAEVLAEWCARAAAVGFSFAMTQAPGLSTGNAAFGGPLAAELGPLRRAIERGQRARRRTSVTIDARALGPRSGGTQAYAGALVLAVARTGGFSVRAVVAHDAPAEATAAFGDAGVEVVTYEQAVAGVPRTDLLHRPQQVFGAGDLNLGRLLSDRLVLTHLDLIAFHTPSYHASEAAWHTHRRMTRIGMTAADVVVFTSAHARADALTEELVDPDTSAIAAIGVQPAAPGAPSTRPAALDDDDPFLLVLGADYAHKNRPFAIRLFRAMRERHGVYARLVLAGAHVEYGSSAADEARLLTEDPALASVVTDLGSVSEAEKQWLLHHATALLCPSTFEGYGLTPLEAAAASTPCIFAAVTALADVLDPAAATITPWDVESSAAQAVPLLSDGPQRRRHLALMAATLERASWEQAAEQLAAAYEQALAGPYRPAAQVAWEQLEREREIENLNRHRIALEAMVGNALSLAGAGGLLSADEQLGLIRIASRRRLTRPVLGPLGWIGRLGSGGDPRPGDDPA